MDSLPIELVTIIAVDSFKLFTTLLLVPTIGNRLCADYPQLIAREKFISIVTKEEMTSVYLNNELHSFNDQPAIVRLYNNGRSEKSWCKYGKLHRRDRPAFIGEDGYKSWFWNGKRHRDNDKPAIVYANGNKSWYRNGKYIKGIDCHLSK